MQVQMLRVQNLPYLSYGSTVDRGQLWLFFSCDHCGDQTKKPCGDPNRRTHWLQIYAQLHRHPPVPTAPVYAPPPGMWRR